jgi:hypothetical protein
VKFAVTTVRPCRMPRGTLRRVPQNMTMRLLGYNLCCPRCGYVTFFLQNDEGITITEVAGAEGTLVSFSAPGRCVYCGVHIRLQDNEATLEEGAGVRNGSFH